MDAALTDHVLEELTECRAIAKGTMKALNKIDRLLELLDSMENRVEHMLAITREARSLHE